MELQFPESDIPSLEKEYWEYFENKFPRQAERERRLINMRDEVSEQRHLTIDKLEEVALWVISSDVLRRHSVRIKDNCENAVREITGCALQSEDERVRYSVMTRSPQAGGLHGVGPVIATAILHLFHKDLYPFLTPQATKAVGKQKKESFKFWQKYVTYCRTLANSNNQQMPTFEQMRTLDRALWWYSEKDDKK